MGNGTLRAALKLLKNYILLALLLIAWILMKLGEFANRLTIFLFHLLFKSLKLIFLKSYYLAEKLLENYDSFSKYLNEQELKAKLLRNNNTYSIRLNKLREKSFLFLNQLQRKTNHKILGLSSFLKGYSQKTFALAKSTCLRLITQTDKRFRNQLLPLIIKSLIILKLHMRKALKKTRNLLIGSKKLSYQLLKYVYDQLLSVVNRILGFKVPKITMPTISLSAVMPKKRRKRGRPRTHPAALLFIKRFRTRTRRILLNPLTLIVGIPALVIGLFVYTFFLMNIASSLPSPQKLSEASGPLTTEFYDRNGKLLYRLFEGKNRSLVKLGDLPPHLVNATIAMEDKNFRSHPGVDIQGMGRALKTYYNNKQITGASTITQQLIKNTLLTPERTFERKVKEIILAFWSERIFTKDEILQMYFNEVPYGGPAWGISAAAQTYFNKEAKDLTLAESAYLSGLTASPTTYSPYGANPELGKARQWDVLRRMTEDGYITQEQADAAFNEQLNINPPINHIKAPHFVMYVRNLLSQQIGEKAVFQGGLKVYTTIDLDLQDMAQKIVTDEVANLGSLNVSNGASMITNAKTGEILAMVGSKDYFDESSGNYNVTIALRQPGSSIKPITYVTGFKQGYSPGNIMLDTPVAFRNPWEVYAPVNYDGKFHGAVTVRTALGSSYNIPAVKMLNIVGIPNMIQTAKDMGLTTFDDPNRYGLSLTLGGGEVKMVEMMTAYGTFAQNGVKHDSKAILKIVDSKGNILDEADLEEGKRVLSAPTAYMISDILSDNRARTPAFGPNSLLNIPNHIVAVKTGTTDSKRDNWTFGYTPEYVVGVWVGNNDNSPMHPQLTSGVTGAAPIWNKIMTNVIQNKPNIAFEKPSEIIEGTVDGRKDLVIRGQSQKSAVRFERRRDDRREHNDPSSEPITFTDPFSTFTTDAQPNTQ